ncbi:MAG: hypothetical protein ACRCYW_05580 [Aeromonas sp.]|uniref:hypothetical protein n=1 Tax=Aeromonas sp. TaxID=647 RepID=UPI003F2F9A87
MIFWSAALGREATALALDGMETGDVNWTLAERVLRVAAGFLLAEEDCLGASSLVSP